MIATTAQLSLELPESAERRVESRMEPRDETVRRVEYTSFPRVGADTLTRVAFTRNISTSGMALGVDEVLPVGSLLRVIVQKADGQPDFDAVARVAWCRENRECSDEPRPGAQASAAQNSGAQDSRTQKARSWLGLVLVAEVRRGLARVPRSTAMPVRRSA